MNIPVDPSAPVRSEGEIEIAAPPSAVWAVLTGIDDWPRWQSDVTEARLLSALGEGAEFRWKAGGVSFRSRVHTLVAERMFGWTGKTLGASAIHNWTFTEGDGATKVAVEESLRGVLPRLFRGFFQKNLDQGIQKGLHELRSAAEAGVSP